MKKTCLFIILASIMVISIVSCSRREEKKPIIIAVIPKVDNAIFDQVKKSAQQAANELGVILTWEAPTSIDGNKQKEIIENLIHYKVDGILISCNDAEVLKDPIKKAIDAGIKVGTYDSDAPTSDRIFYIGTDNRKAGAVCGETMLKLYKNAKLQPQNIILLSGGMGANNMRERITGFKSVIKQNHIEVLNSFEMPDYGTELLSFTMKRDSKVNGIQLIWGVPVLNGVDSVAVISDFVHKGNVAVFFDVSKPLLKYIKSHPNCATMKQDFQRMGHDGVVNMYHAITGANYQIQTLLDVTVIDQSNVDNELKKLK